MNLLNAMTEHGAINLGQQIFSDNNLIVGCYSYKVPIIRCVMNLTERKAVADHRLAVRIAVGNDVRRIQEFRVAQLAEGALAAVGLQDTRAEGPLVNSDSETCGNVPSA